MPWSFDIYAPSRPVDNPTAHQRNRRRSLQVRFIKAAQVWYTGLGGDDAGSVKPASERRLQERLSASELAYESRAPGFDSLSAAELDDLIQTIASNA